MKTIAFFNSKCGVGRTSLVYHLAWMYADLGLSVVAADLDPQANLTSMFLDDDRLGELWPDGDHPDTIFGAVQPLLEGTGDIREPHVEDVAQRLGLLVGDLKLSSAEDELSSQWTNALDGESRAFPVLSAFWRVVESAARARAADLVLIDMGPNLTALNRAALVAAEYVTIPLAPDLYSLQGLRNLGPCLRRWRREWDQRLKQNPVADLRLPSRSTTPAGYILTQHALRVDRLMKSLAYWTRRIPNAYRESVLDEHDDGSPVSVEEDPHCLSALKHYRSVMQLAQEARKPMFFLKPADGALGAHAAAARDSYPEFQALATKLADRCGVAFR